MNRALLIPFLLAALLGGGFALAEDTGYDNNAAPAAAQRLSGTGVVKSVDVAASQMVIAHDPIPALKWPAMVMNFRLANKALADKVKTGDQVKFELKEGGQGAYVITAIEPAP